MGDLSSKQMSPDSCAVTAGLPPEHRALLILDLDETLIHGTTSPLARPGDLRLGDYLIYLRPHLAEFVARVRSAYRLAVWTSATAGYGGAVVANVFPADLSLEFVWTREHCTWRHDPETREEYWVKKLHKLRRKGHDLARVLMVDDDPRALRCNHGNHLAVARYSGASEDTELPRLADYLLHIATCPDLRALEKRRWREETVDKECRASRLRPP